MANETDFNYKIATLYQVVRRISDNTYLKSGTTFEAFTAADWSLYAQALTQTVLSAGNLANYSASFPAIAAGLYSVEIYIQAGGTPALTDGMPRWSYQINWNGTADGNVAAQNAVATNLNAAVSSRAAPGAQMDLINAPNVTAIAAIKTGLGTVPASVAGSVGSVVGNVGGNVAGSVASVTAGVNVTQIAGQTASAAAGVTFPATIAAPGDSMVASNMVNLPADYLSATEQSRLLSASTALQASAYLLPLTSTQTQAAAAAAITAAEPIAANITQIAGQTASAAAGVTFPATIAAPGAQMDLVNAPNATAIAAIKTDLGTIPASVAGSVGSVVTPVTLAASQSFNNSGQTALLPVDTYAISGVEISMIGAPATIYVKGSIAATGDQMDLVGGGNVTFTGSLFTTSYDSGSTIYIVIYNSTGAIYTPSSGQFFSYAEPNWQYYAVAASEQHPTGFYSGILPTLPAANYTIRCFAQSGATPAPTDYCFATATYLPSTLASNLPSDYLSSTEQNQLNKIGTNSGDSPNTAAEQVIISTNLNATVSSRAAPGAQMDLVNAPNTTAIAAIKTDLGTIPASVAGSVGSVAGNVGGNVVGSVGSVVAPVTANVSISGTVDANVVQIAGQAPSLTNNNLNVFAVNDSGTGAAVCTVTVKDGSTGELVQNAKATLIDASGAAVSWQLTGTNGIAAPSADPGTYQLAITNPLYNSASQSVTLIAGNNVPGINPVILTPLAGTENAPPAGGANCTGSVFISGGAGGSVSISTGPGGTVLTGGNSSGGLPIVFNMTQGTPTATFPASVSATTNSAGQITANGANFVLLMVGATYQVMVNGVQAASVTITSGPSFQLPLIFVG